MLNHPFPNCEPVTKLSSIGRFFKQDLANLKYINRFGTMFNERDQAIAKEEARKALQEYYKTLGLDGKKKTSFRTIISLPRERTEEAMNITLDTYRERYGSFVYAFHATNDKGERQPHLHITVFNDVKSHPFNNFSEIKDVRAKIGKGFRTAGISFSEHIDRTKNKSQASIHQEQRFEIERNMREAFTRSLTSAKSYKAWESGLQAEGLSISRTTKGGILTIANQQGYKMRLDNVSDGKFSTRYDIQKHYQQIRKAEAQKLWAERAKRKEERQHQHQQKQAAQALNAGVRAVQGLSEGKVLPVFITLIGLLAIAFSEYQQRQGAAVQAPKKENLKENNTMGRVKENGREEQQVNEALNQYKADFEKLSSDWIEAKEDPRFKDLDTLKKILSEKDPDYFFREEQDGQISLCKKSPAREIKWQIGTEADIAGDGRANQRFHEVILKPGTEAGSVKKEGETMSEDFSWEKETGEIAFDETTGELISTSKPIQELANKNQEWHRSLKKIEEAGRDYSLEYTRRAAVLSALGIKPREIEARLGKIDLSKIKVTTNQLSVIREGREKLYKAMSTETMEKAEKTLQIDPNKNMQGLYLSHVSGLVSGKPLPTIMSISAIIAPIIQAQQGKKEALQALKKELLGDNSNETDKKPEKKLRDKPQGINKTAAQAVGEKTAQTVPAQVPGIVVTNFPGK